MRRGRAVGAPDHPAFAGGVLLPEERTANCPLFTKQLKQILENGGVAFRMNRVVAGLRLDNTRAAVDLAGPHGEPGHAKAETISADAIVVAAGVDTPALIAGVKTTPALYPICMHTLTAPVAYEERAPHLTVVDSARTRTTGFLARPAYPPRAWDGLRLISVDGLPVVGATQHPRLFVNVAHGPAGWGLACGSAKVWSRISSPARRPRCLPTHWR